MGGEQSVVRVFMPIAMRMRLVGELQMDVRYKCGAEAFFGHA